MILEISMHTLVRRLVISLLNLYLISWKSMCLWVPTMVTTRPLLD